VKLVIDASVAVKWLVIEERHELARDVLRDGFFLSAPDLLLTEVANALRNKVRTGMIGEAQGRAALTELPRYFDRFFGPRDTLVKAFEIALKINHPVADCVYLACAQESGAALLTDDETLHQRAQQLRSDERCILLADWTPGLPVATTE